MQKFSVIIPAHNDAGHIRKALESVRSQVLKCCDLELIVICDSCEDDTEAIAREYGAITKNVSYHRDGLSRNAGIEMASGDWILFMDSDDWWLHEYVLDQLNRLTFIMDFDVLAFGFIWKHVGITGPEREDGSLWPNVWSKLWYRKAIGDTRFSDEWSVSDLGFTRAMLGKKLRVAKWNQPLYYYNYMRPGSISEIEARKKGAER